MHWYEKNVMGSGPFKFVSYNVGQSVEGARNPDYYWPGKPYLDGFTALFAPKQSVRVDAIRADRATTEFRGLPPAARDQLVKELGDKITVQESDWNCGSLVTPNHAKKPFDDVRVRRALTLAIDRWHGVPALSKVADMHTVGGIVVWLCQTTGTPAPASVATLTPACPGAREGTVSGTITPAQVLAVTGQGIAAGEFEELLNAIRAGAAYANVHSTTFTPGEIRGHIVRGDRRDH